MVRPVDEKVTKTREPDRPCGRCALLCFAAGVAWAFEYSAPHGEPAYAHVCMVRSQINHENLLGETEARPAQTTFASWSVLALHSGRRRWTMARAIAAAETAEHVKSGLLATAGGKGPKIRFKTMIRRPMTRIGAQRSTWILASRKRRRR